MLWFIVYVCFQLQMQQQQQQQQQEQQQHEQPSLTSRAQRHAVLMAHQGLKRVANLGSLPAGGKTCPG